MHKRDKGRPRKQYVRVGGEREDYKHRRSLLNCFLSFTPHEIVVSPHVALTHFLTPRLKPSGHSMYHQFNIHKYSVLPTECIYVFCVGLRTNSDYFPIQH